MSMYQAEHDITLVNNWYDTPAHLRWVLRLRVTAPFTSFDFVLTEPEMRYTLRELENHGLLPDGEMQGRSEDVKNRAWWDYGQVNEDGKTFSLGKSSVNDVPVILYRDDHINAIMPHRIGLEIIDVLKLRLREIETRVPHACEERI